MKTRTEEAERSRGATRLLYDELQRIFLNTALATKEEKNSWVQYMPNFWNQSSSH